MVACTFAGVNVNAPALSYVKLPLPLGVAVVTLKSVRATLLLPPLADTFPYSNLLLAALHINACPSAMPLILPMSDSSEILLPVMFAAAVPVALIVILSVSLTTTLMPVPASNVNVSKLLSATTTLDPSENLPNALVTNAFEFKPILSLLLIVSGVTVMLPSPLTSTLPSSCT